MQSTGADRVVRPCEGAAASHVARQNRRALRCVVYRQSGVSVVVCVEKRWTARSPCIAGAATIDTRSFLVDGEAAKLLHLLGATPCAIFFGMRLRSIFAARGGPFLFRPCKALYSHQRQHDRIGLRNVCQILLNHKRVPVVERDPINEKLTVFHIHFFLIFDLCNRAVLQEAKGHNCGRADGR